MADWIFLDAHRRRPPLKEWTAEFAHDLYTHWLQGPTQGAEKLIFHHLFQGHLTFTKGLSYSHFQVLFSHYIQFIRQTGRTHILTLETESPSLLEAVKQLEPLGVQGKILPVNEQGQLTASALKEVVKARSGLLCLSWAHPLTGVIQPIHDLIAVCKEHDIKIHLDVSAALGKLSCAGLEVDFLTLDGQLLGCPGEMGLVLSKDPVHPLHYGEEKTSYAYVVQMAKGLERAATLIDQYAMDVGVLRLFFEEKLKALGVQVLYSDVERLPNTVVAVFDQIHADYLLEKLQKEGIFAQKVVPRIDPIQSYCTVSFALSEETTKTQLNRVLEVLEEILKAPKTARPFSEKEAKEKNMRVCTATVGSKEEGQEVILSLLIDEEDGVVADCHFETFGPQSLSDTATAACDLLLRKNYMQARRLSSDLVAQKLKHKNESHINSLLEAIDLATDSCLDIPIEDIYMAPPDMDGGEQSIYPNWENLTNAQKKNVIDQVIEKDIQPYVELDAGGVEVLKVEDNRVTIAYSGNCTSCFSATGATLEAIGNILRRKIFPDLMVVPDLSLLQQS